MTEIEIVSIPTLRPEIKKNDAPTHRLFSQVKEESQVVIHCSYTRKDYMREINISKSTFLAVKDPYHLSELVYSENIAINPHWMKVEFGQTLNFTLIFAGLPKNCWQFDLFE